MASPMKPVPAVTPVQAFEAEQEFGAVVERVQRRDIDATRKGFDEHRLPPEEQPHGQPEDAFEAEIVDKGSRAAPDPSAG